MPNIKILRYFYRANKLLKNENCDAKLLLHGLFYMADKCGRIKIDTVKINRLIFPATETNIRAFIAILQRYGFIRIYYVDSVAYLQILEASPARLFASRKDKFLPAPPKGIEYINNLLAKGESAHMSGSGSSSYDQFLSFFRRYEALKWQNKNERVRAWGVWQVLEKTKTLPDLSVLVLALKKQGSLNVNLSTWLKNHKWEKIQAELNNCRICFGEGIYYGRREDGTRGAIVCSCRESSHCRANHNRDSAKKARSLPPDESQNY